MSCSQGKVAIVTGGSRGIGAAISERLAKDGFAVIVNYAENAAPADAVVAKVTQAGGRALAVRADVSDPEAVRQLFDAAEKAFGGTDVLVNNAGVMTVGNVADATDADFDHMISINLKGSFNTMREAAKRLRDGGRVINFSTSVVGALFPGYSIYTATKAGVEAMTSIFAKELRGRNITVNAVAPGPTATELFFEGKTRETIDRMSKMPPLERLGTPEDIARVVSMLAGPDAGWVNGQTLRANGGYV